jgi:hypothetical protein
MQGVQSVGCSGVPSGRELASCSCCRQDLHTLHITLLILLACLQLLRPLPLPCCFTLLLALMLLLLLTPAQEDLLALPKFGPRKADNTLAAIDASRDMDLATLLQGLGIE